VLLREISVLEAHPAAVAAELRLAQVQQAVAERDYTQALEEYQQAIDVNRISSLAHYRVGEVFFALRNYQSAANAFRESLNSTSFSLALGDSITRRLVAEYRAAVDFETLNGILLREEPDVGLLFLNFKIGVDDGRFLLQILGVKLVI